jgi:hypothetical protein
MFTRNNVDVEAMLAQGKATEMVRAIQTLVNDKLTQQDSKPRFTTPHFAQPKEYWDACVDFVTYAACDVEEPRHYLLWFLEALGAFFHIVDDRFDLAFQTLCTEDLISAIWKWQFHIYHIGKWDMKFLAPSDLRAQCAQWLH